MKKLFVIAIAFLMSLSLVACNTSTKKEISFKAGTYTAEAFGFNKETPISVEVVTSDSAIESVKVLSHKETDGIGSVAAEKLPQQIVDTQSVDIDIISGATMSSEAIVEAVTLALKQAGVDAKKLVKKESNKKEVQVIDADVLVIGAGGAGLSAAIEAADAGKKVVILEKTAITGGNTTRSTGGMNAAKTVNQDQNTFEEGSSLEKKLETAKEKYPELSELVATVEKQYQDYLANPQGYFDSTELFMLDTLVGGKNVNNPELVKVLVENSAETVEWLKANGADLSSVSSFGGASVKRIHRPVNAEGKTIAVGSYLVPILTEVATKKGVEIIYDAQVTELLVNEGAVVGAKSDTYTVNAKSVVIATGGFGANIEMVTKFKPELKGFVTTNSPAITGDGIVFAQAIGANVVDMDQIQIHPTVEQKSSGLITEGLRGDGAILVNSEGKRFVDEVGTRDAVSAAEVAQPGGFAYLIIDQRMVDSSSVIASYISKGYTVTGETLEDLAKVIEVDAENLKATLETWNQAVETKNDAEFNRTSFAEKLDTAPYYAIKVAPGVHHTMGGLQINANAEVLNTNGEVIKGLYAAGEVTGGVHGANRLGGNAVADIIVFGRIAGKNAAASAK